MAVVGNSHVLTLFEGYPLIARELPGVELTFIARGQHKIGHAVVSRAGVEWPRPGGDLIDRVGRLDATHVFVMWRGSQANIRGLLQQGPAFDVAVPHEPDRTIEPDVELIPCSAVEAIIRGTLDADDELLALIGRAQRGGAMVWLMGPPPALPEEAVRERLGEESHFAGRLHQVGVSAGDVEIVPESVRVRLRTILLGVYRDFAAQHGAGFVPPPAWVADAGGLLERQYWGKDITHASPAYGAVYLRELVEVAGA